MSNDWRTSSWGDEISLEYGKALRDYKNNSGRYRVFGSNGPVGWTNTAPLADGPGVILGRKGAYRGVEYSKDPFFVIDTAYYVVPKREFNMRWLYYAIKHYKLGEIDDGSPIPSTTRAAVYVKDLVVPPIDNQNAVASILGAIDDKIELNHKMHETLEAMARATFKSWFIDFDPVRAKMDGRWKRNQSLPGLPAELFDLFPNKLEESSIGQTPTSWRVGQLDEMADIVGGGTPSTTATSYFCSNGSGIPWLSPKDLSGYQWKYISNGATDITQDGLKNSSAKLMPSGAVLFSSRAPIGYVAIAEVPVTTNQGFKSLVPKNGSNTEYLYYFAIHNVEFIESRASGSTFKEISGNGMKSLPALIPSIDLMTEFNKQVIAVSNRQRELRHETQSLVFLRDSLLPKLLSGELSIDDPSQFLQDVPR